MNARGFTLIELMIAVAVIAILAVIAIPAYQDYVTQSRRADGRAALMQMAIAQEQFRARCPSYASAFNSTCTTDSGQTVNLLTTNTSSDGYYTIGLSNVTTNGWFASATPAGVQAGDAACNQANEFGINQNGPVETNAAQRLCWGKQ